MSHPAGHSAAEVWENALGQIQLRVTRQNYDTWLRGTAGLRFEETTLVVGVPTELKGDWLSTRLRTVVQQAVNSVAGPGLRVRYEVREQEPALVAGIALQPAMIPSQATPLNPRFTFGTFLPGNHNRLALLAALDVCEHPDSPYSPLFITGAAGSGKTHLLHAIARQAGSAECRVLLVHAEQFLSEFTSAIRGRTGPAFRAKYRDLEILLIDDVHTLAGKQATIREFFQTVAGLHDLGRRVVVAGDEQAITTGAGARFASELHWGLVARIEEPALEDRIAFLFSKTACQGITLAEEVLHYIALRVRTSLRDLEGALNRVLALARISNETVDIDFAAKALRPLSEAPLGERHEYKPFEVVQAVCEHFGVAKTDLAGSKRTREVTYARHLAMYLLRHDCDQTFTAIADLLGKKDHSTVVHACKVLEKELAGSPGLRADVDAVRARLVSNQ